MARMHGIKRKATHSGASQLPSEGPDLARSSFFILEDSLRAKAVKSGGGRSRGSSSSSDSHIPSSSTATTTTGGGATQTRRIPDSTTTANPIRTIPTAAGKARAESTPMLAGYGPSKGMDFDAKLQYAHSLVEMGEFLIMFPEEKRSVAFYLLNIKMAKLKRVVINRQHPVAIEAHLNLLRRKVPLDKVLRLIPDTCREKSWMTKYLTGMDMIFKLKYKAAKVEFESLNTTYPSNVDILLKLAYCSFWHGDTVDAYMNFLAVLKIDRHVMQDLHLYATILQELEKPAELASLVMDLMQHETKQAEAWVVLAIHCMASREMPRALQSVNRVC
ncbi:hypothetical protein BGZ73_003108 [Actinomortierella ambigua]|nr:hypothetical protein BGZ73_003108 [Actinomortierella ambigua]